MSADPLHTRPQVARLANGLVAAALPLPLQTGAIALFVRTGSRDEAEAEAGFAHAVEHMLFKGAGGRDAETLARAMDALGGGVNAWTGRERICVHATFPGDAWQEALEIVSALALAPHFPEEEWARERGVIFAEMAMVEDDLPEWAAERHWQVMFPGAFGRPVLGTRQALQAAGIADLKRFHARGFGSPRLLLAAAGGVPWEKVFAQAETLAVPATEPARHEAPAFAPGARLFARASEQVHMIVSTCLPPLVGPVRAQAALANQILGAGMSSMLFQEVREKRGLAYSVGSHWDRYEAMSVWSVEASCAPEAARACAEAVAETVARFMQEGADEARLALARRQLAASLRMGLDRPLRVLDRLGDAFVEELPAPAEELAWLEEADAAAIGALARQAWNGKLAISVAGPDREAEAALAVLQRMLGERS